MDEPTDRPEIKTWAGAVTLEVWMEKALEEGRDEEVLALMKFLRPEDKERYRAIWRRVKARRR